MIISPNYEVVDIADETLAVPVGETACINKDIYAFSKAAGKLLHIMRNQITRDELVTYLISEYSIDEKTATSDVDKFIQSLENYGLIV